MVTFDVIGEGFLVRVGWIVYIYRRLLVEDLSRRFQKTTSGVPHAQNVVKRLTINQHKNVLSDTRPMVSHLQSTWHVD